MEDIKNNVLEENKKYLTQSELASRWHVSSGTIINWRKQGRFPFFRLPGSSKVLYPVVGILECEKKNTTSNKKEEQQQKQAEVKRNKPAMSAKPKDWRI